VAGLVVGNLVTQVLSLLVMMVAGVVTHFIGARLWRAPANLHSTIISVLILYFIFTPAMYAAEYLLLALVAVLMVLGKYLLSWRHLHIFNPVALAAFLAAISNLTFASWWVATPAMLPLVLIGGAIITLKIKRVGLVSVGIVSALGTFLVVSLWQGSYDAEALSFFFLYTPIIFFATVMLTEPLSTPGTKNLQLAYGVVAGILFSTPFSVGLLSNTPELALLIANLAFFGFSLRQRLTLILSECKEIARNTFELSFAPSSKFKFKAGQYLEWTLPHEKADARGVRRYFTIASAPTEDDIKLTVRFTDNSSTYKQNLKNLKLGEKIYVTALSGDFVLPKKVADHKYIFIAGGIGVTPFSSIVKESIDRESKLDAVMFYLNRNIEDVAYLDLFTSANTLGLKLVNILDLPPKDWSGERGFLTKEILARHCPDFKERIAYISGPPGMVGSYKKLLKNAGMPDKNIKTDYFPGLA
jgi:glycine betaine catabolism B